MYRSRALFILLASLPALVGVLTWEFAVLDSTSRQFLFGSPSEIWNLAVKSYLQTDIWIHIGITGAEAIAGLLLGSSLGVFVGIVLWSHHLTASIARPYLAVLGSIPIFALAPLLIIWFGVGFAPKVIMSAFGVFSITVIHSYEGIRSTAKEHLDYATMLGATRFAILKSVLLPSACSWLFTSFRINIGVALLGAFIGEFVSSEAGLGHYIIEASQLYDMPKVLFGILNLSHARTCS